MLKKLKTLFFQYYIAALLLIALVLAFFTYEQLAKNQLSNVENPKLIIILIILDLVLFLCLFTLLARNIFRAWHKSKYHSGRLQNKIIFMFCLVAAIPTIIITVFSTIFFNFGIQSWFDQRVSTAISESVVVSESYFKTQLQLIESDIRIMMQDVNFLAPDISYGPERLAQYLSKQAEDKELVEAVIFQTQPKRIVAESQFNFSVPFGNLPDSAIEDALANKIVIIKTDNDNKVRALSKLDFLPNCYLLVSRSIDNKVLDHMVNTKGAASEYERLRGKLSSLEIQFLVIFLVVSLVLLFAAVWMGVVFSSALIKPLKKLVKATEQISEGNFAEVHIPVANKNDEISMLTKAFNTMALELSNQQKNLILANMEIKAQHHFSETVLSGVSAGVVALDINRKISMINKAAMNILLFNEDLVNKSFDDICPEIATLLYHVQDFSGYEIKKEISINRDGHSSILIVRIITEKFYGKTEGYIITFDDITALVLAQRSAAWADVARKVAHEIKNPLTPIHLAAERLRKKYTHEVSDDKNFERYIEIIVKHVKDIGTIVEEFVQFARMPAPELINTNLAQLVRESVFSRKCLDKPINYISEINIDPAITLCDARQIRQVLLNLLKNAEEAIEDHNITNGEIKIQLKSQDNRIELCIIDNGGGFPVELFDRLTEPYITSKSTGTGLGLAIVKKILDDHNVELSFANNYNHGATIKLIFQSSDTKMQIALNNGINNDL